MDEFDLGLAGLAATGDHATFTCHTSGTVEDARAKATRHFAAYFDGPFELTETDAEALLTVGNKLISWQVTVRARAL